MARQGPPGPTAAAMMCRGAGSGSGVRRLAGIETGGSLPGFCLFCGSLLDDCLSIYQVVD